jgi:glycosyltransferase involved in cell wall biosynthesis
MTPTVTVVVPVWDGHVELLPQCLRALDREQVPMAVVVVENASETPVEVPSTAQRLTLTTRATVGAARNAGLEQVDTPYVVFADADDEIAPGSVSRSLDLLERSPQAVGVIGRSLVDEGGGNVHRGIRPTALYRWRRVLLSSRRQFAQTTRCCVAVDVRGPRVRSAPGWRW